MSTLVYLTLAFISGILLARSWLEDIPFTLMLLGVLLVLCLLVYFRRLADLSALLLLAAFALGGFLHTYAAFFPSQELLHFADEDVKIQGTVMEEPSFQEERTGYRLRVDRLEHEGNSYNPGGKVQLYYHHGGSLEDELKAEEAEKLYGYGDRIKVKSTLREPLSQRNPGGFDYREFLLGEGIDVYMYARSHQVEHAGEGDVGFLPSSALALRSKIVEGTQVNLPGPHDDLLAAILFGQRHSLPEDIQENFTRAGVGHLMAVSGLHVGLVAGFALALMRRFCLQGHAWTVLAILAVLGYAYLTGMRPPALRASLMISLGLLAVLWGRERDFPAALSLAALVTLLYNPLLLFSAGFQLSYAATLSIYYLYPLLEKELFFFLPSFLRGLVSVTLAAQVGVLPLVAYHFHQVPLAALFFNLLFLPVMALVVGLGLVGGLLYLVWPALAVPAYTANLPLLSYLLFLSSLAEAPAVHLEVPPLHLGAMAFLYFLVALLVFFYYRTRNWEEEKLPKGQKDDSRLLTRKNLRGCFFSLLGKTSRLPWKTVVLGILLLLTLIFWVMPAFTPDYLEVAFLDVGQGAAVYLETSCGFTALIDAGGELPIGDTVGEEVGERVILPFLFQRGVRELDLAVITHPHEDHYGGFFPVVERLDIDTLWISPVPGESPSYDDLLDEARVQGAELEKVKRGDALSLTGSLHLEVIAPPAELLQGTNCDLNNNSVVIKAIYGKVEFLLTGDMEEEAVQEIMGSGMNLDSRVLKIPHHGGHFDSVEELLKNVSPETAVIQVGSNPFGHPHPDITGALEEAGIPYYRNDKHGAVTFRTDGENLYLETMLDSPALR